MVEIKEGKVTGIKGTPTQVGTDVVSHVSEPIMEDRERVKIESGGRIVVPSEYLKRKGLKVGDIALLSLTKA